ncbi:alcohol dehydrogenase catalytic domain-containing protein, partial [Paracoccus saliphilus]
MTNRRVVEITQFGDPSVLKTVEEGISDPMKGEAQIRQTAIGFNFIDIYQRKGIYPLPLPTGLGFEAAGIVDAVGEGVRDIKPGQRVAY